MQSRWFKLKAQAIQLREEGNSIGGIENKLQIPRSTLSGWFKNIKISQKQQEILQNNWRNALKKARVKAALWHNHQKIKRLQEARDSAKKILKNIDINDNTILELGLALLYLGEGTKKNDETALGNSDPRVLQFFLAILRKVYNVPIEKIRCQLNLRADQNPEEIKQYWAKELRLPIESFGYVSIDKRTKGTKTFAHYKGVCQIRCSAVEIQRKLIYLSNLFCDKVIQEYLGG
ncbi:MAG: hypothetical protein AAB588_05005 [Patescibacteria group bacterium]